jgi:hypothetical protein
MLDINDKILIIGNAESALRKKRDLTEYNKIVRINRGYPQGKEAFIGYKTHFLATSTALSPYEIAKHYGDVHIFWMTPKDVIADTPHREFYEQNAFFYPKQRWHLLRAKLKARPTTGCMTVDTFAGAFNCKVDLLGFDWLKTDTWYWKANRRPRVEKLYNWKAEKEFITTHKNVNKIIGG